jgi:protein phosphatase methylesterase 1
MHGAGHSAMSFAALAKYLKDNYIVTAFDFRGHGDHYTENETDLSEATLVNDSIATIRAICGMFPEQSVLLVGHSMGGSIATKTTAKIFEEHSTEQWT